LIIPYAGRELKLLAVYTVARIRRKFNINKRNLLFTIFSVWILGLRPSAGQGGCLKAAKSSSETSAVITTAVMADLPVLAKVRSRPVFRCLFDPWIRIRDEH
jgi:hypothetical protein